MYEDDVFGADSDVNFDTSGTVCTLGETAASYGVQYHSYSFIEFNHSNLTFAFVSYLTRPFCSEFHPG